MKTIIKISAIVLLIFYANSGIFATSVNDGNQKKISNKIGQYLNVPDFLKSEKSQQAILVEVTVNKDGTLKVNEIYGEPSLQEYVTTQIKKIKMKPSAELTGKVFQYKINFKS
jgi:molecular chaperone DnaK (HSP70)